MHFGWYGAKVHYAAGAPDLLGVAYPHSAMPDRGPPSRQGSNIMKSRSAERIESLGFIIKADFVESDRHGLQISCRSSVRNGF